MIFGLLVSWVLGGLVIGALGRLIAPGHAKMGVGTTILVGIGGSFIGGVVGLAIGADFLLRFLVSVAGAAVIVTAVHGRRHLVGRRLSGGGHGRLPGGGGSGVYNLTKGNGRSAR